MSEAALPPHPEIPSLFGPKHRPPKAPPLSHGEVYVEQVSGSMRLEPDETTGLVTGVVELLPAPPPLEPGRI